MKRDLKGVEEELSKKLTEAYDGPNQALIQRFLTRYLSVYNRLRDFADQDDEFWKFLDTHFSEMKMLGSLASQSIYISWTRTDRVLEYNKNGRKINIPNKSRIYN